MNSSFEYTVAATTRTYYSDVVQLALRIDGDQQRLISGDIDQDIRDIEILVTVKQVWEQSGASDKSPGALWLDLAAGTNIVFKPDTSGSCEFVVVPDLSHTPTFVATIRGTYLETIELRFISKSVYQPADAVMTNLVALMPFFGA